MAEEKSESFPGLPSEETVTQQFRFLVKYWKNRNLFIRDMRASQSGLNKIEAPASTHYVIKVIHTFIMASLMNEKLSRYLARPVMQVIPNNPLDDDSREKSTRIENGLNIGGYEIERRTGGDTWDRVLLDTALLDMGVQRIVCNPGEYWDELAEHDAEIISGSKPKVDYSLGTDSRKEYKRSKGIPITKDYVPLEFFYPHYDGKEMPFAFEIEEKTLYSVMSNPMYKNEYGREALRDIVLGPDGGLNTTVNIIHYGNNKYHAYYLGGPGANSGNNKYPKVTINTSNYTGQLRLLYAYEPEIGRSIWNCFSGRYGGWKTDKNRIEAIGKGIMELSQAADEIMSQVLTNVRAKYWPNLNFKMDPELRGFGTGTSKQEAPKIKEGEGFVSFVGEEILPIFKAENDPMVMWLYDQIQIQVSKLGGSAVLFGERAPGVDTGYNQALQQTQAESLDNKLEQHIQAGAEEEALITCLYVREKINEPVEMCYVGKKPKSEEKVLQYATLDPADLTPMPRFAAQVRKQGPMDILAALRGFAMATDDRGGKGPAFSDETAKEQFLSITAPDVENKKILIEAMKREIVASGVLPDKIGDQINIKLAKLGTPEISPEQMAKADPALLAAIQQMAPGTEGQGGLSPSLMAGAVSGAGLPPGPMSGDPGMNNRMGEAEAGMIQTGASSI